MLNLAAGTYFDQFSYNEKISQAKRASLLVH